MQRYFEQAEDYNGSVVAYADHWDQYGEHHVILKMSGGYYLDWIGGEYAEEPDEFDDLPFKDVNWCEV